MSLFIAFEGGERCGKSTQSALLRDRLVSLGFDVTSTREPGGTPFGAALRGLLLDSQEDMAPEAEALLFAADRAEHVTRVVRPALDEGHIVITDRYIDSSIAYQSSGRGLAPDAVAALSYFATGGLVPDLTIVLDADPVVTSRRRNDTDRIDSAGLDFHRRVREMFLTLAAAEPERYLVLDSTRPISELHDSIIDEVCARMGRVDI